MAEKLAGDLENPSARRKENEKDAMKADGWVMTMVEKLPLDSHAY